VPRLLVCLGMYLTPLPDEVAKAALCIEASEGVGEGGPTSGIGVGGGGRRPLRLGTEVSEGGLRLRGSDAPSFPSPTIP